ncbi:MAG TPA: 2-oxoacid:acceptor oxidoreductase family protein [Acidimicrobiales bacterium]|nr:2-oxoacid:acceptor oxidoreductase family protein [Acidimicrobiales bacterium]
MTVTEVRFHGRGGQGVVTAAELLAVAAFEDGAYAQAFPSFGSERTGAPVASFCRIADVPIRTREPVMEPDVLIVLDPTLLHQVDLFAGLRPDAYVLLNTVKSFDELGIGEFVSGLRHERLLTVPATEMALRHVGRSVPGSVLLGGYAAMTGRVSLPAVVAALRERFSGAVADGNVAAAEEAFAFVGQEREELRRAAPA